MSSRILLHELSREEARDLAPKALIILPVGAVEQHGPHLPVGTDFLTIEYLARECAAAVASEIPILVAPTLPFGSSQHHLPFGGTMSLSTETYYRAVYELAESLITCSFRRIFILNGHGGNHEVVQLVARDLALKHSAHLAAASYWTVAWDALIDEQAHVPGRLPGHAGTFETSQIMALRPDLVREPRPHREGVIGSDPRSFYSPYRLEKHGAWQDIDGYSDSPDRGDASRGKDYLAAIVKSLGKTMLEFYSATD